MNAFATPLLVGAVAALILRTQSQGTQLTSSCCSLASGSCRSICEETSLVGLAISTDDRWRYVAKLTKFCSLQLVAFWSCMNETLHEIDKGQDFFGRPCCTLPQSQTCTLVCLHATSMEELKPACRASDEVTFYACLERQEIGQKCCGGAQKPECRSACREVFATATVPSNQIRNYVTNSCSRDSPYILQCVHNYTLTTPAENPARNLHCCDKASTTECKTACQSILTTQTIGQEIVDNLIEGGCGYPMPYDKLWQCFLANADTIEPEPKTVSQLDNLGMDSAKLMCCFRAKTANCQRLCIRTFSNEWEIAWGHFDRQCQYQIAESAMLKCLSEIEEPCELGCEGLTYCTNFNYRPTELFRNCDSRTDQAAHHDVQLWHQGIIKMPLIDIPVLDIAFCFPDTWKTIACALQIKPCHNQAHVNMICKSDCIKILSQCVDKSRLKENQTPATLCEVLSPPGTNSPCISLSSYLGESEYVQSAADVTHPCKPNSCNASEVCLVNRKCHFGEPCFPHICVKGCRMGTMSQLVIPGDTYVQVPRIFRGKQCHSACYCNKLGTLENCVNMPCINKEHCIINGKEIAHKTKYSKNCTVCFCYAGELRCSKICRDNGMQPNELSSGHFCSCPDHFVPVCGKNGNTYPSPCVARCAGLKDGQFESGSCSDLDPCRDNPCSLNQRCIVKRQVCLSMKKRCPQFTCVNVKENCDSEPLSPVCDTENDEHPNPCLLLLKKRTLNYWGKCMSHCRSKGKVCGYNGVEYADECAAKADGMLVEFSGSCVPIHSVFRKLQESQCPGVPCKMLPSKHCTGIFPPNSCCPICGAALKLVYSQELLDQAVEAVRSTKPATIIRLTQKLQEHVKTMECDLFAYLSPESTVIVLIEPNVAEPSALQVEACMREAEKLQALIEQGSPTILMELPLSALIGAFHIEPLHSSSSLNGAITVSSFSLQLVMLLCWALCLIQGESVT